MTISALSIRMLVVWERHAEIGDEAFRGREERFTQTRKHMACRVIRGAFYMAVGTNPGNWSFARKELLPVTIQAGCMFGKFCHIRKCCVALADVLPVFGWKLVT